MTTTTVTVSFSSVTFTGAEIKEARVTEHIDPLSLELPISTLELTLFSAAGDFSIVNPSGFYASLQYKQPLDVYADIDGDSIYIGKFYLDKWYSKSENEAVFEASDAIGLLETVTYNGGVWYPGSPTVVDRTILSETIIDEIMDAAGITYTLDPSLTGITLKGKLPVGTCRQALQQILFRIGAYAQCPRNSDVRIRPIELASALGIFDNSVTSAQKGLEQSLELRPLVTGVDLDSHNFKYDTNLPPQTHEDTYEVGNHIIYFSDGIKSVSHGPDVGTWNVTGSFASEVGTYFLTINVSVAGFISVYNQGFSDTTKSFSVNHPSLPGGTPENRIKIANALWVNPAAAQSIAQRVFDYYSQRYLQKAKLFGQTVEPGNSVIIATQSGKWIAGIVERMETDLAGGFVSNVEIIGVIYGCDNILTANLTLTANYTVTDCLDLMSFNLDTADFNVTIN